MARKYTMRSKEEKLAIVKAVLSGMPAQYYENQGIVDHHTVMKWVKKYEQEGEAGLEAKKKPGNVWIKSAQLNCLPYTLEMCRSLISYSPVQQIIVLLAEPSGEAKKMEPIRKQRCRAAFAL